ncbi:MAG: pantoate--beta-alanine ligase [Candidatus Brocadiia bacterium]
MEILRTVARARDFAQAARQGGATLGLVPTMGALHEGHLSLVRRARQECQAVVASVFVNPTQFGPGEDLESYPRDLDRDAELAAEAGVDALFAPSAEEMYPPGFATYVVPQGPVAERLEGACRPGHFRGVLTVCCKLFAIVAPHRAYFGRKDYQQALLVRRMVRDLDLPLAIVLCPIVREPDGLALSSRNRYLDAAQRRQAASLCRGLRAAQDQLRAGETRAQALAQLVRRTIEDAGPCTIDYVALADPETLEPLELVDRPAVALVAVRIGETRLIDNLPLTPKE